MGDRILAFVAHVGKAEGLAFDFAVAAVDDEMMFFAQIAHQLCYVDAAIVFDASESEGAKFFFSEKFEAACTNPFVNERVRASVASKTRRQSFAKNFLEF